jgi:hypothetical protein
MILINLSEIIRASKKPKIKALKAKRDVQTANNVTLGGIVFLLMIN